MGVSLEAYRAAIGLFNHVKFVLSHFVCVASQFAFVVGFLLITIFLAGILIYLSNDIELNPGPASFLSFGHLNVRSINNIEKFDEISYLVNINNFHIFALTETWLNERISSDCFQIPGYNPIIRLED